MSFVTVEKPRPYITLITLNRPERMNAMAFDVMVPFKDALEEVSFDNETRVVVVTGAGAGFCSGADLEDPGWSKGAAGRRAFMYRRHSGRLHGQAASSSPSTSSGRVPARSAAIAAPPEWPIRTRRASG